MRVLLDGTKLLDRRTDGIKRYVGELVRALANIADRTDQIDVALAFDCVVPLRALARKLDVGDLVQQFVPALLAHDDRNPLNACQSRVRGRTSRGWQRARDVIELQAWKLARSGLRRYLDIANLLSPPPDHYDLVHLTLPNTWRQLARYSGPRLTTVHDLSHLVCPHLQTPANNQSLADGLAWAQGVGSQYIAVSQATANDLCSRLAVPRGEVDVVLQGIDRLRFNPQYSAADRQDVRERYGLTDQPFLFSLGTIEPRKNLLNVVRAFLRFVERQPAAQLVIGGYRGWGDHRELDRLVSQSPHVQTIGYLREEDLPALYSTCAAFCYVSQYEGFGLPLVEAMSCGAPVIYGDNSAMPEVAGRGGIGVSADDPGAIAAAMQAILSQPALRTELSQRALAQAAQFDWRQTAEQTLAVYDRCLRARTLPMWSDKKGSHARAA